MNLPISVTQNELMEILLNVAVTRPVFIWELQVLESLHW